MNDTLDFANLKQQAQEGTISLEAIDKMAKDKLVTPEQALALAESHPENREIMELSRDMRLKTPDKLPDGFRERLQERIRQAEEEEHRR